MSIRLQTLSNKKRSDVSQKVQEAMIIVLGLAGLTLFGDLTFLYKTTL